MKSTDLSRTLRATGIPLAELARISGVSINTIRSLATGRNVRPRVSTRAKLAAALRAHSEGLSRLADQLDPV